MFNNHSSFPPQPSLSISPHHPWLAPLAGYSDLPFRLLCRHFGCSAAFTEMISAKGVIYQTKNTLELLKTCPDDSPLIVQLFGSEPEIIFRAVNILINHGFVYFDLNCGCSVKKVLKTGSGAALLKTPDRIVEISSAMTEAAGRNHTGIKIRLGYDSNRLVYLELAAKLAASGLGWITLHPRTAVQLFSGKSTWMALRQLKESTNIPIIASGDLFTARDGMDCVQQTGVDNIMFARGALNNPGIFTCYLNLLNNKGTSEPDRSDLQLLCLKTIDYYRRYSPSHRTILKMRTILPRMIKEIPGAKELRKEIVLCNDWKSISNAVDRIC